jgi:hypothetical protein
VKKFIKEFEDKNLQIISQEKLIEYIKFCKINNNNKSIKFKTSHHHILPRSIFPEFVNLKEHSWNGSHLTYEDHYKAHSLLAESINHPSIIGAWWAMNFKDRDTKGIDGLTIIGAKRYSYLFQKSVQESSERNSKKVTCIDSEGNYLSVERDEFTHRDDLVGVTKGKLTVIDKETNRKIMITSEEYKNNKERYFFHKRGTKRKLQSIEKERKTKQTIQENGLTLAQNSARKGVETLKNTIMEDGRSAFEHMNEKRSKTLRGEGHPSYGKKSIYNKELNISKRVLPEDIEEFLNNGWVLGGKPLKVK